jgi:hypothetical protein
VSELLSSRRACVSSNNKISTRAKTLDHFDRHRRYAQEEKNPLPFAFFETCILTKYIYKQIIELAFVTNDNNLPSSHFINNTTLSTGDGQENVIVSPSFVTKQINKEGALRCE